MPRVPLYDAGVPLRPSNQQGIDVRVSPEAFGSDIGRGMQQLGAGVGHASDAMAQVQAFDDATRAKDADNSYSSWLRERMYGDGGFLTLEGRNAVDGRAAFEREAEQKRREFGAKLSGGAANAYETASTARLQSVYQDAIVHTAQQRKAWFADTSKARIASFENDAMANYSNPAKIGKSIAGGVLELRDQGKMHGWDADTQKAREAEFVSGVQKNITLRLAQDDPLAADAYMKGAGDTLLEADRYNLSKSLESPILSAKATRNVAALVGEVRPQKYDSGAVDHGDASLSGPLPFKSVVGKVIGMTEQSDAGAISDFIRRSAGVNVDPRVTPWCAAFVNSVLGAQGIEGTGKLNARSFLSFGTATDKPRPGDIVVLSRGDSEQGHVGFFQGFDDAGNVMVLGGNQSDGVNVSKFDAGRVLGFRSAGVVDEGTAALPNYGPEGLGAISERLAAISDPKEREATQKALDAYYTAEKRAIDSRREQAMAWVESQVVRQDLTSFNVMEIDPAIQAAIGTAGMTKLLSYQDKVRASGQPTTDERALYDLQMQFADDPEGFASVDIFQYRDKLSNSDFDKVRGWQQTARADRRTAKNEGLKLSEAFGLARTQLNAVGIKTGDGRDAEKDAKRVAAFHNALADQMDEFKRLNDGKNPTQGDVQSMINRLLLPVVIKEPGRLWGTNSRDALLFESGQRADGSTVDVAVEYADIPVDLRQGIASDLANELRRTPSKDEVASRYEQFLLNR